MYQSSQLISGAPITDDSAPGGSEPAAARKWTTSARQTAILVQLVDGTSATATAWTYDGSWAEANGGVGNEANLVAGTPAQLLIDGNSKTFVQLTSVVGSPTLAVIIPLEGAPSLLSRLAAKAKGDGIIGTAIAAVTTAITAFANSIKACTRSEPIVAHDSNTITATRAILIGQAGDITVKLAEDSATRAMTVTPGIYPLSVVLVHTDTTVPDAKLFALY